MENLLIKRFNFVMDESRSSEDLKHLRCTISSNEEAAKFIQHFSYGTDTSWKPYRTTSCKNYKWYKVWNCQDSSCQAKIWLYVKDENCVMANSDPYLSLNPPLPCVVKINCNHHHNFESALWKLEGISYEVKEIYLFYFDKGLSPAEARHKHIKMLTKKGEKNVMKSVPSNALTKKFHRLWVSKIKSRHDLKDNVVTSLVKEFLDGIPKQSIFATDYTKVFTAGCSLQHRLNVQKVTDGLYPLVFQLYFEKISTSTVEENKPLQYILLTGKKGLIVTPKSGRSLSSIIINSPYEVDLAKQVSASMSDLRSNNSSSPGLKDTVNCHTVKNASLLNSRGETSIMPVIFKIHKEECSENPHSGNMFTVRLNNILADDCSVAKDIRLPLIFTVVDSSSAVTLYRLTQGPDRKLVYRTAKTKIYSAKIGQPNDASVRSSELETENQETCPTAPVKSSPIIKEEPVSDDESSNSQNFPPLPVILDVVSCADRTSLLNDFENAPLTNHSNSSALLSDNLNTVSIKKEIIDTDLDIKHELFSKSAALQEETSSSKSKPSNDVQKLQSQVLKRRKLTNKKKSITSIIQTRKQRAKSEALIKK